MCRRGFYCCAQYCKNFNRDGHSIQFNHCVCPTESIGLYFATSRQHLDLAKTSKNKKKAQHRRNISLHILAWAFCELRFIISIIWVFILLTLEKKGKHVPYKHCCHVFLLLGKFCTSEEEVETRTVSKQKLATSTFQRLKRKRDQGGIFWVWSLATGFVHVVNSPRKKRFVNLRCLCCKCSFPIGWNLQAIFL